MGAALGAQYVLLIPVGLSYCNGSRSIVTGPSTAGGLSETASSTAGKPARLSDDVAVMAYAVFNGTMRTSLNPVVSKTKIDYPRLRGVCVDTNIGESSHYFRILFVSSNVMRLRKETYRRVSLQIVSD